MRARWTPIQRPTTPTTDIAPLVEHIATLEAKVERLTEASTMWQIRARQAEEQLKQLTAGASQDETAEDVLIPPEPEPVTMAPESPSANATPQSGPTGVMVAPAGEWVGG